MILGQVGLHVGFEVSGAVALFSRIPAHLRPGVVDTSNSVVGVFPALTVALISLQQGDRDAASVAYEQAGPVRAWRPSPALSMSCWAHGLAVAIGLGRTADVAFLAKRFEPFRGRHVANGAGAGVYMGPVELQVGRAGAALGRVDAAVDDLETAVSVCEAVGARGYRVEASVELAAALAARRRPGDRDHALAVLDAAAPAAAQLRMAPFLERITGLRARLLAPGPARSILSARERQVADLVGRGLTNKQIAESLFVSERTAENHVQHILTKLSFSNRSQIAAWTSQARSAPGQ